MKLQRIDITNFLRISRMKVDLGEQRIHLFAGHNQSGKTSLQEGIRFCMLGETDRVSLKREYPLMVHDGTKDGEIRLVVDGDEIIRDVATGKGTADSFIPPHGLAAVLDATRYAWMDDKKRRAFLFKLLNVSVKPQDVRERLADKKIPDNMIDETLPLLRAGFDAVHNKAREKATQARGEWKGITGETYGPKKAPDWIPPIVEIDADLEAGERQKLNERALAYDQAIATQAESRSAPQGIIFPCPKCKTELVYNRGEVQQTYGKRTDYTQDESVAIARLQEDVARTRRELEEQRELLNKMDKQLEFNTRNEEVKSRADHVHRDIEHWATLAEQMAPDGIPAQIIAERLKPINDRLRQTAALTGWGQVNILADMTILVDGRLYTLQSESSQWQVQASITEAISAISGLGLFVLDRIDVLDVPSRPALLKWLMKVAKDHSTILLLGTLKEPPKLPGTIKVHWLEGGRLAA